MILTNRSCYLILILLLQLTLVLHSQDCLTEFDLTLTGMQKAKAVKLQKDIVQNKPLSETKSNRPLDIPISIHVLGSNKLREFENGTEFAENIELKKIVQELNIEFKKANMTFSLCGSLNYSIGPDTLSFNDSDSINHLLRNPGTVNVYIVENIGFGEDVTRYAGFATLPQYVSEEDRHIVITRRAFELNGILNHEMGHYFGLYHTHTRLFGAEFVNGSNCDEAGDLHCDTPADPNLLYTRISYGCAYQDDVRDANGDTYAPDINNFMSYSPYRCIITFSPEQLVTMRHFADEFFTFTLCSETDLTSTWIGPNPITNNTLRISIDDEGKFSQLNVYVFNINGQRMRTYETFRKNTRSLLFMNTTFWDSGVYFITIEGESRAQTELINTFKVFKP